MKFTEALSSLIAAATLAQAQLSRVNDFNASPTRLQMYAAVPPRSFPGPHPIVVAVHHCQGSATGYSGATRYVQLGQQNGFIAIYPNSKSGGGCFDVASTATLTHNGGGDSQTIANMVKHAVEKLNGDPNRVFAVGTSSGAMMSNVLAGVYPDVFKAVSVYSGVPAGCFAVQGATATQDPPGWANSCANGQLIKTAQQWGDQVRNMYPGYNGTRPRLQIFHGTSDNTLRYPNYNEQLKQWSNVLGLSNPRNTTNTPRSGWTRSIYGEGNEKTAPLVGYSAQGVGHSVPQQEAMDLAFFGITN
ncbi:Alpha/Beta hydrolase protein [Podospora fimiseda]|uniref:Carboxylic ester hydrolase n=1 Tax=Podospora fimiseda TaxID=252190 RepID=A0AAN7BCA5_9PEZI|nr:Alpha/Beta hydrolase protein [Podospora fimiseda]